METIKAIIVDDEEFARSSLYFLLQENCPNIQIEGIAKSVAEARLLFDQSPVDLVFLDIAMPGENGFELITAAQLHGVHVVFTTAFDQYALRAIKANALDYLLKPIDIDELKETVEKASKYIHLDKQRAGQQDNLISLRQELTDRKTQKKLSLPNGQGYTMVDFSSIIHIEADSNYSIFNLSSKEKITVSKSLKEYEDILPEDQFIRIHKSSIINLNYLVEYNSRNGLEVILKDGSKIAVSRRRASDFLDRIKNFTANKHE
ncbi:LytR/AlgR family response regulator transcription factor [Pedobacter duraquae]|uniref:LytTR family two component transcriptional regulator n=1 Tax=Pedobacter duraquae TaxID=425511 RepID=A0A4R6IPX5_9SPHI|nr:LytTR family DNA-binding domain-containing protein [Pedobacter duraquae]TDO24374.1 LytTR family two component transcriptional regulator [Pedobacter duraquae]